MEAERYDFIVASGMYTLGELRILSYDFVIRVVPPDLPWLAV